MNDAQQRGERTVMKVYDEHAPMLFRIASVLPLLI